MILSRALLVIVIDHEREHDYEHEREALFALVPAKREAENLSG